MVQTNVQNQNPVSSASTVSNENLKKNDVEAVKSETKDKKGFADHKDKNSLVKSLLYGIGVLISAVLAFYIRTIPKAGVFLENGFIRFGENDPWYHWRNVDFLLHNYPNMLWFDPATTYPYGTPQAFAPLYDIILATAIKILQTLTGNLSEEFAMTIAAYWPCVLAAVCVVAVYFVAKTFFNSRNIGLFSAFLLAIAPGQFLSRSIIGFNDHHVAEVLFSSLVILFLAMTLIKARGKDFKLGEFTTEKLAVFKPILPFAVLTGLAMGTYTLIWEGALLFAFIIGVYITIQMLINHLKGEGTAYIAIIGIIVFAIDLLMISITPQIGEYKLLHIMALGAGIVALILMGALSFLLEKKKLNRLYYPATLIGIGIVVAAVGSLVSSTVRNALLGLVSFFTRTGGALTIGEASPFFGDINPLFFTALIAVFVIILVAMAVPTVSNKSKKTALAIWPVLFVLLILFSGSFLYMGTTFSIMGYVWLFALPMMAYIAVNNNSMEKLLLVVWTVVLLWAMVQQNRFSYYFIVPLVILTSWIFMRLFYAIEADKAWETFKKNLSDKKADKQKKSEPVAAVSSRQEKAQSKRDSSKIKAKVADNGNEKIVMTGAILLVAFALILVPTAFLTSQYTQGTGGPNDAWIESSLWIRDNTPEVGLDWHSVYEEPLQDLDGDGIEDSGSGIGIEHFENQASVVPFEYPGAAYGVLSWWDYGHWLEVIGERMVNANPFQFGVGGRRGNITDDMIPGAAPFFVAETEKGATGYLVDIDPREDKVGARYIVTDIEMASGMSKFYAMTAWTLDTENYTTIVNINGQDSQVIGSERYLNSMVFRLHMLDAVGLEQYRLVHESLNYGSNYYMSQQESFYKQLYNQVFSKEISTTQTGYVKTFEFVKGAVLTGTAAPNESVELSLTIQTNQGRIFNYNQTVKADASGSYSFTVPYSTTGPKTGETNFAVKPIGNYTITTSAGEQKTDVSEDDVLKGNIVKV